MNGFSSPLYNLSSTFKGMNKLLATACIFFCCKLKVFFEFLLIKLGNFQTEIQSKTDPNTTLDSYLCSRLSEILFEHFDTQTSQVLSCGPSP